MSDETGSQPPPDPAEAALLRELARRLSSDEKALRDHEVAENAKKYFGGLTPRERVLLGLDNGPVITEEMVSSEEPRSGGHGEWIWAALSIATFLGVLCWVLFGFGK